MLFFGKKRKKEQEIDEAFAKVYQEIETIDNWNDPKKLEHYIFFSTVLPHRMNWLQPGIIFSMYLILQNLQKRILLVH